MVSSCHLKSVTWYWKDRLPVHQDDSRSSSVWINQLHIVPRRFDYLDKLHTLGIWAPLLVCSLPSFRVWKISAGSHSQRFQNHILFQRYATLPAPLRVQSTHPHLAIWSQKLVNSIYHKTLALSKTMKLAYLHILFLYLCLCWRFGALNYHYLQYQTQDSDSHLRSRSILQPYVMHPVAWILLEITYSSVVKFRQTPLVLGIVIVLANLG